MVEPINLQILVTNIDEVAKSKNVHEHSILGQQINAGRDEAKDIERRNTTVVETGDVEKKGIKRDDKERGNEEKRYILREDKKKDKKNKNEKIEKAKEPNKGERLDIEI